MNPPVYIRPEAERNIEESSLWYQERLPRLGDRFLNEIEKSILKISNIPTSYPVIHNNIRRVLLQKFPFAVFYLVAENSIIVLAAMHGSRHPKRW